MVTDLELEPDKSTVRLFFDILHGINQCVSLGDTLELGVLIGFDGQLKQKSDMEMSIFNSVLRHLVDEKLDGKEQALVWLYVKTWEAYGEHIIDYTKYFSNWAISWQNDYPGLWTFDDDDLEAAFITMAYPKKEKSRKDWLNFANYVCIKISK